MGMTVVHVLRFLMISAPKPMSLLVRAARTHSDASATQELGASSHPAHPRVCAMRCRSVTHVRMLFVLPIFAPTVKGAVKSMLIAVHALLYQSIENPILEQRLHN